MTTSRAMSSLFLLIVLPLLSQGVPLNNNAESASTTSTHSSSCLINGVGVTNPGSALGKLNDGHGGSFLRKLHVDPSDREANAWVRDALANCARHGGFDGLSFSEPFGPDFALLRKRHDGASYAVNYEDAYAAGAEDSAYTQARKESHVVDSKEVDYVQGSTSQASASGIKDSASFSGRKNFYYAKRGGSTSSSGRENEISDEGRKDESFEMSRKEKSHVANQQEEDYEAGRKEKSFAKEKKEKERQQHNQGTSLDARQSEDARRQNPGVITGRPNKFLRRRHENIAAPIRGGSYSAGRESDVYAAGRVDEAYSRGHRVESHVEDHSDESYESGRKSEVYAAGLKKSGYVTGRECYGACGGDTYATGRESEAYASGRQDEAYVKAHTSSSHVEDHKEEDYATGLKSSEFAAGRKGVAYETSRRGYKRGDSPLSGISKDALFSTKNPKEKSPESAHEDDAATHKDDTATHKDDAPAADHKEKSFLKGVSDYIHKRWNDALNFGRESSTLDADRNDASYVEARAKESYIADVKEISYAKTQKDKEVTTARMGASFASGRNEADLPAGAWRL